MVSASVSRDSLIVLWAQFFGWYRVHLGCFGEGKEGWWVGTGGLGGEEGDGSGNKKGFD